MEGCEVKYFHQHILQYILKCIEKLYCLLHSEGSQAEQDSSEYAQTTGLTCKYHFCDSTFTREQIKQNLAKL